LESKNELILSLGIHERAPLYFLFPVPNFHTEFQTFLPPHFFSPACSRLQASSPRYILHMQAGQCGTLMSSLSWEVVCDEHGIGDGGEYCGDNVAQLGPINVFYHEVVGGKYAPRELLMDFESGVIDAAKGTSSSSPFDSGFSR
jgi:tubulin beta